MLAEFSIFPLDKGAQGLSEYVSELVRIVQDSGLPHELHAMGTIVEGEPEEVYDLLLRCHLAMRQQSERIYVNLKVDDRPGRTGALQAKVAAVRNRIPMQEEVR